MNHLTNNEVFELQEYVTNQLTDIPHILIDEIRVVNGSLFVRFLDVPGFLISPLYTYNIFIFKVKGLYKIRYNTQYYDFFVGQPITTTQLYEIEDIDDVFNVLEDIFDTLRPRDEY